MRKFYGILCATSIFLAYGTVGGIEMEQVAIDHGLTVCALSVIGMVIFGALARRR